MSTTQKSDFVDIELTPAAAELKQVRVANGHLNYVFTPGKPVRVLTSEWSRVLSKEQHQGQAIFQVSTGTTSATSAADQIKTLQAEEAVLEQEIAQEGSN
ncbi:hypothetical protein H7849_11925 [Alloacidobacterium dinghuense]|uniref:Uncharacterized protein n=1 Tax=Alloacidobacterium dinghuense TaxID=2763107 RepID=A0A7G8BPR4_9BACT|nr:hypothetical protein [Alloacidobacterium dinghuense]QNI34534.1 hypothetical protein H7849_11925 [Alloacidobacterium dinghuense]